MRTQSHMFIFEVHSLHFAFLIPMQPKQETAVGRFHSRLSFIGLLSIWVKTLVPRAIFLSHGELPQFDYGSSPWVPQVWIV